MRRTHLRRHENVLKRLLVHVSGLNLGLLMRKRFGVGTPCGLQGRRTCSAGWSSACSGCGAVLVARCARCDRRGIALGFRLALRRDGRKPVAGGAAPVAVAAFTTGC